MNTEMDIEETGAPPAIRRRLDQLHDSLAILHDIGVWAADGVPSGIYSTISGSYLDEMTGYEEDSDLTGVPSRLIEEAKRVELGKLKKMQVYKEVQATDMPPASRRRLSVLDG